MTQPADQEDEARQRLLAHYKAPRNWGTLPEATHRGQAVNPLCGDEVTCGVLVEGGVISRLRFHGTGCAIMVGTASLLSEHVQGATTQRALWDEVRLQALVGCHISPSRLRCLTLSTRALEAALQDYGSEA